jgi:hypothetical protein
LSISARERDAHIEKKKVSCFFFFSKTSRRRETRSFTLSFLSFPFKWPRGKKYKKKRDNKKVGIKINFHFEIDKMVM